MKKGFFEDNQVLEYLKLLKSQGRLDEESVLEAVDILSEPGNSKLMKGFFEENAPKIADIVLNSKPFPQPDESIDGPIRIGVAENNQPIGFYPHECHFLIAGQTGSGKSTLLRLIFSQVLLLNEESNKNGENHYLDVR